MDTGKDLNCLKTNLYMGAVRTTVYIISPLLCFVLLQILIISCLKYHHEEKGESTNVQYGWGWRKIGPEIPGIGAPAFCRGDAYVHTR